MAKPRVNFVLTGHSIRYGYQKAGGVSDLIDVGEEVFPTDTLKNGEVIDTLKFKSVIDRIIKSKNRRWKGRDLAFTLIDDTVYIERVTIPGYVTEREAIEYIRTQDGYKVDIPFDASALSVTILNYNKSDQSTDVVYYAYPLDKFNRIKELLTEVGLKPVIADLTGPSVFRYYTASMNKSGHNVPPHVLVTQWNRSGVYISTFSHGIAVFTRHIKIGLKDIETASEFDVRETIHNTAMQISRVVDFYHTSVVTHDSDQTEETVDATGSIVEAKAKPKRRGTRASSRKAPDTIEAVIVAGDFPFMHIVKSELEDMLSLNIHDFPEHGDTESVKSGHKARKNKKGLEREMQDAFGVHGRSTRMSSFALEQAKTTTLKDIKLSEGAHYIDVYGLGLKSLKPEQPPTMPKQVKVKRPKQKKKIK